MIGSGCTAATMAESGNLMNAERRMQATWRNCDVGDDADDNKRDEINAKPPFNAIGEPQ